MLDRDALLAWYRRNRARTRTLFDLLADETYYSRPIELRHPIVFYEGHLPGFSFNTLVKKALGGRSIDERLEAIFARGIDPHESSAHKPQEPQRPQGTAQQISASAASAAISAVKDTWPSREEVHQFAAEADARVLDALCRAELDRPGDPLLDQAEAVFTILEHEAMHHETLLYMWHRLPIGDKRRPPEYRPIVSDAVPAQEWVDVPGGRVTLGVDRREITFGWDNEFPRHEADVRSFAIERFNVTNAQFLEFVDAGGYQDRQWWRLEDWDWVQREHVSHPLFWKLGDDGTGGKGRSGGTEWLWRAMFERIPMPLAWPVYVSYAEAEAYARWRGLRLMTEAEYQRAAFGSSAGEREHPWGDAATASEHGVFDFSSWDPEPVGTHPEGVSAFGVEELVGNGWEWTSSMFAPFPGFRAMASYPEYSADFFDGQHIVMKGASPATAAELLRPTFRNWFRPRYPYVYATFRCVK
jgi:ergothioneine biosynthesis protein EgtB